MAQNSSTYRKRFDEGMLNAFAVALTILPIFSLGYFGYDQFFGDPRHTVALTPITASHTPRLFEEGLVTVTFDDGWESIYSEGAALFDTYDIPTTQYILPGEFENHAYLSVQQTRSLQRGGHEIASHTMNHPKLTTVNNDRVDFELNESKKLLRKHNFAGQNINFAAPESATNESIDKKIAQLYVSHRNTFGDITNGIDEHDINVKSDRFNRFNIIGYTITKNTTQEQIRQALRYAKENKGWLVLVYHQVDTTGTMYSVSPSELENHLKIIRDSGVKAATMQAVLENTREGK